MLCYILHCKVCYNMGYIIIKYNLTYFLQLTGVRAHSPPHLLHLFSSFMMLGHFHPLIFCILSFYRCWGTFTHLIFYIHFSSFSGVGAHSPILFLHHLSFSYSFFLYSTVLHNNYKTIHFPLKVFLSTWCKYFFLILIF